MRSLQTDRMDPRPLELTDFCDKRTIIAKVFRPGKFFESDLRKVETLRNKIAHSADYILDDGDISRLIEGIRAAEHWISELDEFP